MNSPMPDKLQFLQLRHPKINLQTKLNEYPPEEQEHLVELWFHEELNGRLNDSFV